MITSPLPKTIRYVQGLPRSEEHLVNMVNFEDSLITRMGVSLVTTGVGACRGRFVFNEKLYQVSGDKLIRINPIEKSFTVIGDVSGTADIDHAIGFNQAIIIVKGGGGYVLEKSEVLTPINDPDFLPSNEVARVNGRFVFSPSDGSPIMYSDLGDGGSIGALSFFDAEVLTDKNTGVFNFRNDLYVFGEESIQLFRDAGSTDNPFLPITGATAAQGYIAGKIEFGDTFLFLGKEKDQEAGIFAMGQGGAKRVSTPPVDSIIQQYTPDDLRTCHSQRIVWRGHDFLCFTLPEHTFCFYRGAWSYFQSVLHYEELANWTVRHAVYYQGQYYTGSTDSRIGVIDDSNSDFGDPIRRVIKTFVRFPNDAPANLSSLSLAVSQGQNLESGSVGLRLSDDGSKWSQRFFKSLTDSGDKTFRIHWEAMGGLGHYRNGFVGVEFYTTSEVVFSVDGLTYYE